MRVLKRSEYRLLIIRVIPSKNTYEIMRIKRTIVAILAALLVVGGGMASIYPDTFIHAATAAPAKKVHKANKAVIKKPTNDKTGSGGSVLDDNTVSFDSPDSFTVFGETVTLEKLKSKLSGGIIIPALPDNLPPFPDMSKASSEQDAERIANKWLKKAQPFIDEWQKKLSSALPNYEIGSPLTSAQKDALKKAGIKTKTITVDPDKIPEVFAEMKKSLKYMVEESSTPKYRQELKKLFKDVNKTSFSSPQTLNDAKALLKTTTGLLRFELTGSSGVPGTPPGFSPVVFSPLKNMSRQRLETAVKAINNMQPADISRLTVDGDVALSDIITASRDGKLKSLTIKLTAGNLSTAPGGKPTGNSGGNQFLDSLGGTASLGGALSSLNFSGLPELLKDPIFPYDPRDGRFRSKKAGKFYFADCSVFATQSCILLPDDPTGLTKKDDRYLNADLRGTAEFKEPWPVDILGVADVPKGVQGAKPSINTIKSMPMRNTEKLMPLDLNREDPSSANGNNPHASWLYENACLARPKMVGGVAVPVPTDNEFEDDTQLYSNGGMAYRKMMDMLSGFFGCEKIYPKKKTGCFPTPYFVVPEGGGAVGADVSDCHPAMWIRLMADSCANQYIAKRSFFPDVKKYILNDDGRQPGITEQFCQPLRILPVFGKGSYEYRADEYLEKTFKGVLSNDYYPDIYPDDKENPAATIKGLGITLASLGTPLVLSKVSFDMAHDIAVSSEGYSPTNNGTINMMATFPYERIFDVYHPFSPRYDFKDTDRSKYSKMTFMGVDGAATAFPIYVAMAANDVGSGTPGFGWIKKLFGNPIPLPKDKKYGAGYDERGGCSVRCSSAPVDIMTFRTDAFDRCIGCRIKANFKCFWGEVFQVMAHTKLCRKAFGWLNPLRYIACAKGKYGKLGSAVDRVLSDRNPISWYRHYGFMGTTFGKSKEGAAYLLLNILKVAKYKCKTGRSKKGVWPMCSTKFDVPDAPTITGDCRKCQPIKNCCHDLAKPLAGINVLKIRTDAEGNMPEGYTFREYFGNHRPYMRWWDTTKEAGQHTRPTPDYYCQLGSRDTIIGVGREAKYHYTTTGNVILDAPGESCRIGGGGGIGFGCIPPYQVGTENNPVAKGANSLTGWTELKLYQTRCNKRYNLNCLCQYEKLMKPGAQEELALIATGGEYQSKWRPVLTDSAGDIIRDAAGNALREAARSVGASYPFSWRGYITDPLKTAQYPNRFPIWPGTSGTPPTLIKGMDNAVRGDILIWDMNMPIDRSKGQYKQIPTVAVVTEAHTPASGIHSDILGATKDVFVRVVEFNHGKIPDACGGTSMMYQKGIRTIRKNRPALDIERKVGRSAKAISGNALAGTVGSFRATTSCIDPLMADCVDPNWDNVKIYRIRDDVRETCPLLKDAVYADTKALDVLPNGSPVDAIRPIAKCIMEGKDPTAGILPGSRVLEGRIPNMQPQGMCSPNTAGSINIGLGLDGALDSGCPGFRRAGGATIGLMSRKIISAGRAITTANVSVPASGKIVKLPCGGALNLVDIVVVNFGNGVRVVESGDIKAAVSGFFTGLVNDILRGLLKGFCPHNLIGQVMKKAVTLVLNTYGPTGALDTPSSVYAYIKPHPDSNVSIPPWGGVEIDVAAGGGEVTLPMGGNFMSAGGKISMEGSTTITADADGTVFISDGRMAQVASDKPLHIDTDAVITNVSYKKPRRYYGDSRITVRNNKLVAPAFGSVLALPDGAAIEIDISKGGGVAHLPYGGSFPDGKGNHILMRIPTTVHVDSKGNIALSDKRHYHTDSKILKIEAVAVSVPPGTAIPLPKKAEIIQPVPIQKVYYDYKSK